MLPLAALILLHSPGGHEIYLNPAAITQMHAAIEGEKNKLMTNEARCVINTSDGKFVSVVEPCEAIRRAIQQMRDRP